MLGRYMQVARVLPRRPVLRVLGLGIILEFRAVSKICRTVEAKFGSGLKS